MKRILTLSAVSKVYGDRELFNIKHLEAFMGDRIGLIGPNGCGKSTLMKMLGQVLQPDTGDIILSGTVAYMPQPTGEYVESWAQDTYMGSLFGVKDNNGYSGGERTKRALTNALAQDPSVLLLDEPTTNMDLQSIEFLENELYQYMGTLIVVSHDKQFINRMVDVLWILEAGSIRVFNGTVDEWEMQKQQEQDFQMFQYEQDQKERKRLEEEAARIRVEAQKVGRKPKNMSAKEARLYSGIASIQQGHVQRRARQLLSRKEHKNAVERPQILNPINIKLGAQESVRAKQAIVIEDFSLAFGDRQIFNHASAIFKSNECTVILGPNGSGKTTLIHEILANAQGIKVNPGLRFGVFSQFHEAINMKQTLFENVMKSSIHDMGKVRTVLANLRFSKEDIDKQANKLSGGERAKCVLAMLIVSDINALIMDEPSNHLDLDTQNAMLELLEQWEHTMILISHDRRFIETLGDECYAIENCKLVKQYD